MPENEEQVVSDQSEDSILTSVKKKCGLLEDYEAFDDQIIMDINAVFLALYQMGVGPNAIFTIENKEAKWADYFDDPRINVIKPYVGWRVKLMFDPPSNSSILDSMKDIVRELEFRMNVEFDKTYVKKTSEDNDDEW